MKVYIVILEDRDFIFGYYKVLGVYTDKSEAEARKSVQPMISKLYEDIEIIESELFDNRIKRNIPMINDIRIWAEFQLEFDLDWVAAAMKYGKPSDA
jgi:hypothetical protein